MSRAAVGTPDGARARLDSLTGARIVAALGVFLYHAGGDYPAEGVFGRALAFAGRDGRIGVDFFFVLSGFVLAWSWRAHSTVAGFYRRRFARIAPAYWVALVYGLLWVIHLYGTPVASTVAAIPAMLGIQAWFPDPAVHFAANGVEWSVSAELFFYALFPLLILLVQRRGGRVVVGVVAVAIAVVVPLVLPAVLPADVAGWALETFPPVRIGEFMCGLLLAVALKEGRRVPVGPRVAGAVFLACYVLLPFSPTWFPRSAVFLAAVLLVIAALAQSDLAGRRTLLSSRVAVRLGQWSYCFYLVHQVTLQLVQPFVARVVPGVASGPVWLVVALLVTVGLSALLYATVERPLERRLRGDGAVRAMVDPTVPTLHRPRRRAGSSTVEPVPPTAG